MAKTNRKEARKSRLMMTLTDHIGRSRAISMTELYRQVYEKMWSDKINDTRALRKLINELRQTGIAICSTRDASGGGYYLASAGSELTDYCQKRTNQALKILAQVAKMRKIALPELVGQLTLDMGPGEPESVKR